MYNENTDTYKSEVLIVAKCNVNWCRKGSDMGWGVVLIVAKCNVNINTLKKLEYELYVLIVAKCNVNDEYEPVARKVAQY